MNNNQRIEITDSPMSMMTKLAEGNPGATNVLIQLFKESAKIDPDSTFQELSGLFFLDIYGIYGHRIWMFYKDVCSNNLVYMEAIMRAVQMGLMNEHKMYHAIDNRGDGIDLEDTLKKVREKLPDFAKDM